MRIIVWGINYAPELTGIAPFNTGLCDYLRAQGHEVEMVTAFPYYPFWKKIPGDRGRFYRTDDFDGVWVHRCWHYVPKRVTTLRRMWHELSFGLASFLRIIFLARADVYIVASPPLLLGPLASLVGWLKQRPYVFHVQDLQPDAAVGLGMVKVGRFTRMLYRIEAWAYRHAAIVSGISEGMVAAFTRKNVPAAKRLLFPNWIRWYGDNVAVIREQSDRVRRSEEFRRKFGIPTDVFLASYSGNLGRKQGLETLVAAAEKLAGCGKSKGARAGRPAGDGRKGTAPAQREDEISNWQKGERGAATRVGTSVEGQLRTQNAELETAGAKARSPQQGATATLEHTPGSAHVLILIVGDGVMRAELEAQIASRGLKNVRMMPLLQEHDYHGMLAASDVSLILQAPGTGQYFFPSKLLSILSAGSPVLSVADGGSELAKAVVAGEFGVNVRPADADALANAVTDLTESPDKLQRLRDGTRWVEQFTADRVLGDFERRLRELVVNWDSRPRA